VTINADACRPLIDLPERAWALSERPVCAPSEAGKDAKSEVDPDLHA